MGRGGQIVDAVERAEVRTGGVELHRRQLPDLVDAGVQHVDTVAQAGASQAAARLVDHRARPVDAGHAVAVLRQVLGIGAGTAPEIDDVRAARHQALHRLARLRPHVAERRVGRVRLVVARGNAVERPLRVEQHH
jgi:hypothetical protein